MNPAVRSSPFWPADLFPDAKFMRHSDVRGRWIRRIILCTLCLVLAGAVLPGCKNFKVGTSGRWGDDAAITAQIKALIAQDEELSHAGIRVFVQEGNVTLSGTVPNGGAKLRLLAGVKGLNGVRSIGDDLEVRKPG